MDFSPAINIALAIASLGFIFWLIHFLANLPSELDIALSVIRQIIDEFRNLFKK